MQCFERNKLVFFFTSLESTRLHNIILEPNTSYQAVGAVLLEQYDNSCHPMAYFSKKYNPAERDYAPHDIELLIIFKPCQKWSCYIDKYPTTFFANHKPLVNIQAQPQSLKKQARWLKQLNELPITIVYKHCPLQIGDTLSQKPQTEDTILA